MPPVPAEERLRIDKWLCYARFVKTRGLATGLIENGLVMINDSPVRKASLTLKPGDEVTLRQGRRWRKVRVLAMAERRGGAPEAQALYEELEPPVVDEWA